MPEIATQSCAADVATSTPSSPIKASPQGADQSAKRVVLADRYKTKLCDKFLENGKCPYDRKCMFAHGEHELRTYEMNLMDDLTTEENIRQFRRTQRIESQRSYYENYCLPDMMETMSLPPQYYQGAPPPTLGMEKASVLSPPQPTMRSMTPPNKSALPSSNNSSTTTAIPAPRSATAAAGKNSSMTSDPSAHHETGSRTGTVEYNSSNCGESEHDGEEMAYQGNHQHHYYYHQGGEYISGPSHQYSYAQQQQYYCGNSGYNGYNNQYWNQQQQQYPSGVYYYPEQHHYAQNYQQLQEQEGMESTSSSSAGPYRSAGYQKEAKQQQQRSHAPPAVVDHAPSLTGSVLQSEGEDIEAEDEPVHKRASSRASSNGSVYRYDPYGTTAVDNKYLSHKRGSELRDGGRVSAHP